MSQHEEAPVCSGCLATGAGDARLFAPIEEGIGRRTFLVQSGILAAAALLAACGGESASAPIVPPNTQIDVGTYPALANVGGVALVSLGGSPVAIVRTGTSSFLALSRICPHQGGIVNQSGSRWVCPVHGATFDLNGNWIGGQRTSSLHQYSTTYDSTSNTLTVG